MTDVERPDTDSAALDAGGAPVDAPSHYVGIGASAGGLEAIEALFSGMPRDTGMAFIVVQHLSPDHKSLMVELLSKRTDIDVARAENGSTVRANTIYLIPPKRNLTIFHGKLLLSDQDHSKGINLPIDIFLRSLADDQADRAIAIILSGTGSDGMRGVRAIKEAGGTVIAQDPSSARFDGMPRAAISTGLADVVLPPEDMPRQLEAFAKHQSVVAPEPAVGLITAGDGMDRVFALLRERTRVDFTFYKPSTVLRRIDRRMTLNQVDGLAEYVRLLEARPGEVVSLYRELLIGVTSFFRDPDVFEELEERVLPALLESRAGRESRFWVAGCSSGEEAYTLAILAREGMERLGRNVDLKIFATDVDRDAVLIAGNGLFPESIAVDVPPRLLQKYFQRRDDRFQISRSIREMVVFAQHNLVRDPPFTNIDLVSCRNLLIYLQPVLQQKVLDLFNFSLNEGGVLLLGTSETIGERGDFFETIHHKHRLYRSRGRRRPIAEDTLLVSTADAQATQRGRAPRMRRATSASDDERVLERFLGALSGTYVPLAAIVNEHMEVLHLLGDGVPFFRLPPGKPVNDVTKLAAPDLAIPLATAIQKALKSHEETKYTNVRVRDRDGERVVDLRVMPLPGRKGQEPLAAAFVEEADATARRTAPESGAHYDAGLEAEQRVRDLENELQFTRESLQATIEELETSNEELQATNEELLASNEELQSTNEELQSVNEELYTVNAEYQSKILELTELTNDMDNLLTATRVGTLFLDENLEIRKFTPEIAALFKAQASDVGRPIRDLAHRLQGLDPFTVIERVQKSATSEQLEARTVDGRWYLLRVIPYNVGPNTFSGVVLTAVEISLLKETQKSLAAAERRLEMAYDRVGVAWWDWHVPSGIVLASPHKAGMLGYRADEVGGTVDAWTALVHPDDREAAMQAMRDHLRGAAVIYEVTYRLRTRAGGWRAFRDIGSIVERDAEGRATRLVGTVQAMDVEP